MSLLIDANLSPRIADRLRQAGQEVVHVKDVGLLNATDNAMACASPVSTGSTDICAG